MQLGEEIILPALDIAFDHAGAMHVIGDLHRVRRRFRIEKIVRGDEPREIVRRNLLLG
jgi:hypothetical protein